MESSLHCPAAALLGAVSESEREGGCIPQTLPILSERHIDLIETAAPAVQAKIMEVTEELYHSLFREHPNFKTAFTLEFRAELRGERAMCPESYQANILAETILAALGSLRDMERIAKVVARVNNKHVSRDIKPVHYKALRPVFLGAVETVLRRYGLFSEELMDAFNHAYDFLAYEFIKREEKLRNLSYNMGGWAGFRTFTVAAIEQFERHVTYTFRETEPASCIPYVPGQYTSLRLQVPGSESLIRSFPIKPSGADAYVIDVSREPKDYPMTNAILIHTLVVGSAVELSCPVGSRTRPVDA